MRALPARWFDPAFALALLVAAEAELLAASDSGRSLVPDALLLAALIVPIAWRRRAPLAVTCVVMAASVVVALTPLYDMNLVTPNVVVVVLPYSVAAYESQRRAVAGLAVCLGAMLLGNLVSGSGFGSWLFAIAACMASWLAGRALRAHRELAEQLRRTAERLRNERNDRERLAVAEERTRIAHQLQGMIARSLTAMVVQSQMAQRLLDSEPARADEAMVAIEDTGHQALTEMRGVLGALRELDGTPS